MTKSYQEKLAIKILKENLVWDIEGIDNGISDGEMEQYELDNFMKIENLIDTANEYLLQSFKDGYLVSQVSRLVIESKHLKFLGKEKLREIEILAANKALSETK